MDIIAWACVTSRDKTYFSAFCLLLNILGNFNFRQYKKHLWHFENNFVTKLAIFSCVLFDRFWFAEWSFMFFLYKNRIKKDITQSDDSLWLVTNPKGLIYKSGSDNGPIGFKNLEDFNFCSLAPLKNQWSIIRNSGRWEFSDVWRSRIKRGCQRDSWQCEEMDSPKIR